MSAPVDLTGMTLGKLKVIRRFSKVSSNNSTRAFYECICECGDRFSKVSQLLLKGNFNCRNKECISEQLSYKYYGQKFGYVTIKSFNRSSRKGRTYFNCVCECGTECIKAIDQLKSTKRQANCGCKTNESFRKNHPGVGRPAHNRMPGNEAAKKQLYDRYMRGAKTRDLAFELDFEEFIEVTGKPCTYCNREANKRFPAKITKGLDEESRYYHYNGIDRVDTTVGYTIANSAPCCEDCNYAKSDLSQTDFLELVARIYKHSIAK